MIRVLVGFGIGWVIFMLEDEVGDFFRRVLVVGKGYRVSILVFGLLEFFFS